MLLDKAEVDQDEDMELLSKALMVKLIHTAQFPPWINMARKTTIEDKQMVVQRVDMDVPNHKDNFLKIIDHFLLSQAVNILLILHGH